MATCSLLLKMKTEITTAIDCHQHLLLAWELTGTLPVSRQLIREISKLVTGNSSQ